MIGKLELIGEWADGSLELTGERRMMDMKMLNETIRQKVYEIDLQFLLAGLITILGIHQEAGEKRYALEVRVPLFQEEGVEYDLRVLDQRAKALRELQERGFYLETFRDGTVRCFKEGALEELERELDEVETALVT